MRLRGLLPLCGTAVLCACTPLGVWVYEDPAFEVSRVRVHSAQAADSGVVVALQVWNPNDFEITTARLELLLRLDGHTVGHFARDSVIAVPRGGTATTVSLSFVRSSAATPSRMESFRTGTHRFLVEGRAVMKTPIGDRRVRVAHAGDLAFGGAGSGEGAGDPDQPRGRLEMPERYPAVWRQPESHPQR
jgi:LEA14-like dessication related protein